MNTRNEEIKAQYHQKQRQGMQDLRFMLFLLSLGLILYTTLSSYMIFSIQEKDVYLPTFLLYEVGSFVIWCIIIRMLWNFNRLGRILYLLGIAGSIYLYRDILAFVEVDIHPEMYKYFLLMLFLCKCVMLLLCAYRLSIGKSIRYIWSVDTMFDEDLALLEAPTESALVSTKKVEPLVAKAQSILKKASLRLGIVLYLSVIVILFVLNLLQNNVPTLSEGISVIQYALFSECLFSVMLWSAPVIALYIGKTWSPYLIYVAMLGELLRLLIAYQSYLDIFYNKIVPLEVKLLFVMIELMRYILLLFACRSIRNSRLIKQYSRMKMSKPEQ